MERIHCSHCQDFGDVWCIGIDEILDMESYKDGNVSVSRQVDQKGHMLQLAALHSIYSIIETSKPSVVVAARWKSKEKTDNDALGLPPVHQHANNSNLRSHRRWIELVCKNRPNQSFSFLKHTDFNRVPSGNRGWELPQRSLEDIPLVFGGFVKWEILKSQLAFNTESYESWSSMTTYDDWMIWGTMTLRKAPFHGIPIRGVFPLICSALGIPQVFGSTPSQHARIDLASLVQQIDNPH
jgi:hypothetical protein